MIYQTLKGEFLEMARVQGNREDELLSKPNVVGVALGHKNVGGEDTGEPALLVLVQQKLHRDLLTSDAMVPAKIDDRKTDVVEVGPIFAGQVTIETPAVAKGAGNGTAAAVAREAARARVDQRYGVDTMEITPFALQQRIRPIMGGFSVGHFHVTAGTIATCCYDMSPFPGIPQRYYVLSNNHVLANSNAASVGDPILQPGPFDGGSLSSDVIGRLTRFVPIQFSTPTSTPINYVDAAIAEVPFHMANRQIYWIGHVKDLYVAPTVGDILQKTGRTTNYSTGRVTAINATVDVNYGGGRVARFAQQILTTPMSAGGDSGSLVLDLDENAVGLLFAGSPSVTVICNILYVQSLLGIRVHEK